MNRIAIVIALASSPPTRRTINTDIYLEGRWSRRSWAPTCTCTCLQAYIATADPPNSAGLSNSVLRGISSTASLKAHNIFFQLFFSLPPLFSLSLWTRKGCGPQKNVLVGTCSSERTTAGCTTAGIGKIIRKCNAWIDALRQ